MSDNNIYRLRVRRIDRLRELGATVTSATPPAAESIPSTSSNEAAKAAAKAAALAALQNYLDQRSESTESMRAQAESLQRQIDLLTTLTTSMIRRPTPRWLVETNEDGAISAIVADSGYKPTDAGH